MLLATLTALIPLLGAQADRYGLPACDFPNQELARRSGFILCFDASLKVPVWTAHEVSTALRSGSVARPKRFRHDYQLSGSSAFDSDYRNSSYSRGHMVPAADLQSEEEVNDSFLLSNAVPQSQAANAGAWRRLENAVRALAGKRASVVITGTVFDCDPVPRIGSHQVAVPCATFKAVLIEDGGVKTMYAAIIPNSAAATQPVAHYAVTVDELQRRTHLDLFSELSMEEQEKLESESWPIPTSR